MSCTSCCIWRQRGELPAGLSCLGTHLCCEGRAAEPTPAAPGHAARLIYIPYIFIFLSVQWVPVSALGGSGSPLAGGSLGFAGSHKGRVFLAFHSLLLWAVCGIYLSLKYL